MASWKFAQIRYKMIRTINNSWKTCHFNLSLGYNRFWMQHHSTLITMKILVTLKILWFKFQSHRDFESRTNYFSLTFLRAWLLGHALSNMLRSILIKQLKKHSVLSCSQFQCSCLRTEYLKQLIISEGHFTPRIKKTGSRRNGVPLDILVRRHAVVE